MTQCLDLTPRIVAKVDIWDIGAVLLIITGGQLLIKRRGILLGRKIYEILLAVFIAWMIVCLIWSVVVYGYPMLDTLKASRQMIIGYLSFFIFSKLFQIDSEAFNYFLRWLYRITFFLLLICIIQALIKMPILHGLYREYAGVNRYLPVFLPICLLYFNIVVSKLIAGEISAIHEYFYAWMVPFVVATTYTRGVYIAVACSSLIMLIILILDKRVKIMRTAVLFAAGAVTVITLVTSGLADRVINRFASGLDIIFSDKIHRIHDDDSFTGRIELVKERFNLVAHKNPLFGFGFIHEENVSAAVRRNLKYGSVIYTPENVKKYQVGYPYILALRSADIGWADVMINTGIVGLILIIACFGSFLTNYKWGEKLSDSSTYHVRLACFLQVFTSVLLMFNGNTLVALVQIPAFFMAGYSYCIPKRETGLELRRLNDP
jgi:hypothetical protein